MSAQPPGLLVSTPGLERQVFPHASSCRALDSARARRDPAPGPTESRDCNRARRLFLSIGYPAIAHGETRTTRNAHYQSMHATTRFAFPNSTTGNRISSDPERTSPLPHLAGAPRPLGARTDADPNHDRMNLRRIDLSASDAPSFEHAAVHREAVGARWRGLHLFRLLGNANLERSTSPCRGRRWVGRGWAACETDVMQCSAR
jgi:hypothetical protein